MVFKVRGAGVSCPPQGVTATYDFHFIILQMMKSWKTQRMRHVSWRWNPAPTAIPVDTATGKGLGRGGNVFPTSSWVQTLPVVPSTADSAFSCGYSEVTLAKIVHRGR